MLEKTVTLSDLIQRLQEYRDKYGDLPVYARDADTRWRLPIGVVYRTENKAEEWPERVEIRTDYHGRPKGDFE